MPAIRQRALVLLAVGILLGSTLHAAMVQRMDLAEVCERADKIFRGTVISVNEGSIAVGGVELPTVSYRIRVEEAFQGSFSTKGEEQFTEITMLAKPKPVSINGVESRSPLSDLPELAVGGDYLLMTSRPSAIGLTAPIGLGQGCYAISGKGDQLIATDGLGNSVVYSEIAERIRAAAAQ